MSSSEHLQGPVFLFTQPSHIYNKSGATGKVTKPFELPLLVVYCLWSLLSFELKIFDLMKI